MDNRVYYGQYSLQHWIDLMLKKNIILPDYQRYFVWNENKVKTLIETFKKKQFVPPITVGAFKDEDEVSQNLILDGQQRLTSVLLAYLGLYPDPATFKNTLDQLKLANDNDDEDDEDDYTLDNILKWDFRMLTEKGKNKQNILSKIVENNYKKVDFNISDDFLRNTFLGFSYLVPQTKDQREQQKYYSSVFRNINIQGQTLLAQESRASLYFLNKDLVQFFDPDFSKHISIKTLSSDTRVDFVRFLALLSQYAKDGNSNRIARGYKQKMETYYEEYIYSVVGENTSLLFKNFSEIFPDQKYKPRFDNLEKIITDLDIPKQFSSIIDLDIYLLGIIYTTVFEDKKINISKKIQLFEELDAEIAKIKSDEAHKKAPSALKYLKERINSSIEIYKKYDE